MPTPADSKLGQRVDYPRDFDPTLLFAIARAQGRESLGIGSALPFIGTDRWHAYEISWLDPRGKPCVDTAMLDVPADSPHLIESKSLKLYLNSLNNARFDDADALRARIAQDLSACAGAAVAVTWGLPPAQADDGVDLDAQRLDIDDYGPPNPVHLSAAGSNVVEALRSGLLKSNCPVTGQPDWASVHIDYRGPAIDRAGLLRYLISFRQHCEFHELCVERIFRDILARCRPSSLSVQARYTRRGGLDINPWRATSDRMPPPWRRDIRQ
jgi:7-cyano-7-deazaguanine reductase